MCSVDLGSGRVHENNIFYANPSNFTQHGSTLMTVSGLETLDHLLDLYLKSSRSNKSL